MHCTTLKRTYILFALFIACFSLTSIQVLSKVPLDSIVLSDPCILPDRSTMTYYMTGWQVMEKQRLAVLGRPLHRSGNRPRILDGAETHDLGG